MSVSRSVDSSGASGAFGAKGSVLDQLEQIGKEQERFLDGLGKTSASDPSDGVAGPEDQDDALAFETSDASSGADAIEARLERLERAQQDTLSLVRSLEIENKLLERELADAGELCGLGGRDLSSSPLDAAGWGETQLLAPLEDPLEATTPEAFLQALTQLAASPEAFAQWIQSTFGDVDPDLEEAGRRMILGSAESGDWSWIAAAVQSLDALGAEGLGGSGTTGGGAGGSNGLANASPGGNVESYAGLKQNKELVNDALDRCQATPEERAMVMAMGMQETNTLSASDRDQSKDGGASENVSAFNLNADLVRRCGYTGDLSALNDPRNTDKVVSMMVNGMREMGTDNFLNFVRGGSQAFNDGHSYGAADYRASIFQSAQRLMQSPEMMTNDQRVANFVPHV